MKEINRPKFPPMRLITEGSFVRCKECGSSVHRKWFIFNDGCIQPECKEYYKKCEK
jgi:hypothetical protein